VILKARIKISMLAAVVTAVDMLDCPRAAIRSWVWKNPRVTASILTVIMVFLGSRALYPWSTQWSLIISGSCTGPKCPTYTPSQSPEWPSEASGVGALLSGIGAMGTLIVTRRDRRRPLTNPNPSPVTPEPIKPTTKQPRKPSHRKRRH